MKAEPVRMCAGCREHSPKKDLIRVVRTPEGGLILDARGKASGRGVYLCRNPECLKKARKSRALERMLSIPVPPEAYDELEARIAGEL